MPTPQDLDSPVRVPSLRDLVYRDHREEVRAAAQHMLENSSNPDNYVVELNRALSAKVNSLSVEECERYGEIISTEKIRRKTPPSKDEILA